MPDADVPKLLLHPRAAPGDRLRVWVGAFERTAVPQLTWKLDGVVRVPAALRPVASARSDGQVAPAVSRAFTGVYEFSGAPIQPGTRYHLSVTDDAQHTAELDVSTLPAQVPAGMDESFNVLLISCFFSPRDRAGLAGRMVAQLPAPYRPDLTLFLGDQVYLDLPALKNFDDDEAWLAAKFEKDYLHNFRTFEGARHMLSAAPGAAIPDDHDYWNNYPHVAYHIQNTWTDKGRERWTSAARAAFDAFQRPHPTPLGQALELDVDPLFFFVMDTRSLRREDRSRCLDPAAMAQLQSWTQRVAAAGGFGVVATGAPLSTEAAGTVKGRIGDYALPDYGDYTDIVRELGALADRGRPVLLLTGDVHWGRITEIRSTQTGGAAFYELISSPTSLVETLGADQIKSVGAAIGGLFGKKNPWLYHADPKPPAPFFANPELERRLACEALHIQKGSHAAVLSFRRAGPRVELRVSYWPIHADPAIAAPRHVPPIRLRPVQ